ncbi:hypothetical protein [Cellulomonas sp. APG4]|uniref:hypothetical protein n=1 Tax=Cellulomonas sp. APG4 TaxID=1538656 RepID=UPI00192A57D6|nr:hypothetical protein [Cellulomonas sp. APG4]
MNGSNEHLPLMADCERGLGRPERALAIAQDEVVRELPPELQVELALVVSGARLDLGDPEAALAVLDGPVVARATAELRARVVIARAAALEAAGRAEEASSLLAAEGATGRDEEDVVVYDLESEASAPRAGAVVDRRSRTAEGGQAEDEA